MVMDKGVIVETGRHDDLLAKNGAYARLYQAQAQLNDIPQATEGKDNDDN